MPLSLIPSANFAKIAFNFNGVPFQLVPRAASEIKGGGRIQLLHVNAAEAQSHGCRHLVRMGRKGWELAPKGTTLVESLIYSNSLSK